MDVLKSQTQLQFGKTDRHILQHRNRKKTFPTPSSGSVLEMCFPLPLIFLSIGRLFWQSKRVALICASIARPVATTSGSCYILGDYFTSTTNFHVDYKKLLKFSLFCVISLDINNQICRDTRCNIISQHLQLVFSEIVYCLIILCCNQKEMYYFVDCLKFLMTVVTNF